MICGLAINSSLLLFDQESVSFFFFNDTATTEIYTLSLHDALPIWHISRCNRIREKANRFLSVQRSRSEEHTSELQSPCNLVCRLLLEKIERRRTHPGRPRAQHTAKPHPRPPLPHRVRIWPPPHQRLPCRSFFF